MVEKENQLEKKTKEWISKGKRPEEITYGMLCEGFQSISGIPDDFYSAEDPADRTRLWNQHKPQTRDAHSEGEYKGYGEWSN